MKRLFLSIAVVFLLTGAQRLFSQEQMAPPKEITGLKSILGTFKGESTMMMEGKSIKGSVRHTNSSIVDGWGILMDEVVTMEDGSEYKSHNIVGYDAGGKKIHVYSVTNAGETHDHKGGWKGAKTVSVQYDGMWEGKPYVENASLTITGPDSYTLTWKATKGGKVVGSGEEKLVRAQGDY